MLTIVVNGEPREVPEGTSVRALIELLSLVPEQVAVERNREVVPRAQHATVTLEGGDKLELVTFVGDG